MKKKEFIQNLKKKITNFISKYKNHRRLRIFFSNFLLLKIKKIFVVFLLFLIILFFALKFFKPQYLNKIYTKSGDYFFHKIGINNLDFTSITVDGNIRVTKEEIISIVEKVKVKFAALQQEKCKDCDDKLFIKTLAKDIKLNLPWVNKVNIAHILPNKLNIFVTEYEPFAIWYYGSQKYIIDKDGNRVKIDDNNEEFSHLVTLFGNGANLNAKSLFNIMAINPEFSANISSATWVGDRRWNIRFDSGLLVKLPSSNINESWSYLIKFCNIQGSLINLNAIDLRIKNKIYLEYKDKELKEIRDLKI